MCEHKNKKVIDWIFSFGVMSLTLECLDCKCRFYAIDKPIVYDYTKNMVTVNGTLMAQENYERILELEKMIEDGDEWNDS